MEGLHHNHPNLVAGEGTARAVRRLYDHLPTDRPQCTRGFSEASGGQPVTGA